MDRIVGLVFVVTLHAAVLWELWHHRLLPAPTDMATLFVNFIAPPVPERQEEPRHKPLPKPKPIEKAQPRQLIAVAPVVAPTDYVAPPPPPKPEPAQQIEAPPMPLPAEPLALSTELAVSCPERSAPAYPAPSRRFGEEGMVVLRVELDEGGRVAAAQVQRTSGYPRLDEAALNAVRIWRCTPARRDGQPVRAVALQPFKFILQGN